MFSGRIPDMTDREMSAFEELSGVYEPDRRKRLRYDVRRKHARVDLIRLAHELNAELATRRQRVDLGAKALDIVTNAVLNRSGDIVLYDVRDEYPVYWGTENADAAKTIAVTGLQTNQLFQLDGSDVVIGMWDNGEVLGTHQEFASGRVDNVHYYQGLSYHSTAVAGTLVASGIVAQAKGMSPDGSVRTYNMVTSPNSIADALDDYDDMWISNHSYGELTGWSIWFTYLGTDIYRWYGDLDVNETEDWRFGNYDVTPLVIDRITYDAIYHLTVWAAGNDRADTPPSQPVDHYVVYDGAWKETNMIHDADGGELGYDSLNSQKVAKNSLVVGAVTDLPNGYNGPTSVVITAFSSFGPTDDGRIKPDIVANGSSLYTADKDSTNDYQTVSGTSFAAPNVTGALGLLLHWHARVYGTNATPMLASTIKALVIHTADECGASDGPDYKFGWGLMNAERAAWVITNNASWSSLPHIKEVALNDGDFIEFDALASSNSSLRVTIAWTDPDGTFQPYDTVDPTNLMLLNDLDLRVISPGGSTNFPWVLDPPNPTNAATASDNFRDNVEQVVIESPTNDWYTIRVSHKGILTNAMQDVSIIVTGNTATNAPDFMITDAGVTDSNGTREIEWRGVVGALYAMDTSTNLLDSLAWSNNGEVIGANVEPLNWIDSGEDRIRFYRLRRLR